MARIIKNIKIVTIFIWWSRTLRHGAEFCNIRGYHFLPNRGVHEKGGVHRIFSWEIGGSQKNQEIIGWLQILMKILFNEVAKKMHIFCATCIGGYMFLQHCSSGGGSKNFWSSNRGSQKYCRGAFGNSWPPFQRKWWPPNHGEKTAYWLTE